MLPKAMQCFWVLASTHSFTRGLSRLGFANSFTTVPSKNLSSLKLCNDVLTTQIVKTPVLSATSLSMASEMVSTANNTEAETTTQNSIKSVEEIKSVTLSWVTSVIIGLNFCPFARKPFEDANLFVQVVQGSHEGDISDDYVNDVLATVMRESALLKEKKGTTIGSFLYLIFCPYFIYILFVLTILFSSFLFTMMKLLHRSFTPKISLNILTFWICLRKR